MPTSIAHSGSAPLQHALSLFHRAGGTLLAGQARAAGVHPRTLAAMLRSGVLQRPSRGVYVLSESPPTSNPDLMLVALKAPDAVVCLVSALAFHEMTTQIPHQVDLALTRGARAPRFAFPPARFYRFGGRSMTEGIDQHRIGGLSLRVFNPAKTVADCFKFRHKIGTDVAVEALRSYLRRRGAPVEALMRYAGINRVRSILAPYLEAVH